MQRNSPIPRISIVVPVGQDLSSFEDSLISVLEHQERGYEVIVAHDGLYDDPFDLSDEVRFVTSESSHLVDLISTGAQIARGRFVHVLCGGYKATDHWVDSALEKFELGDVAAVAPVIRDAATQNIVGAGWYDHSARLCDPIGTGNHALDRQQAARIDGVFLEASFWRRELLRSATNCYRGSDVLETSYCVGLALRAAGWRCVAAENSEVDCSQGSATMLSSSLARGRRLAAIRASSRKSSANLTEGACASLQNLLRPSRLIESIGWMSASLAAGEMKRRVRIDEIPLLDETEQLLTMPSRYSESRRRAA